MKGQRSDINITVSTQLSLKMVPKFIALILLLCGFVYTKDNDHDQFTVISTSEPPSDLQYLNDRLSKLESHLEIREALSALNESINDLKKSKHAIITEIESAVEKKLKVYDAQLKDKLVKSENAFLVENEKRTGVMKEEMAKLKEEIISVSLAEIERRSALMESEFSKSKKEIISISLTENEKRTAFMKNELVKLKEEIISVSLAENEKRSALMKDEFSKSKKEIIAVFIAENEKRTAFVKDEMAKSKEEFIRLSRAEDEKRTALMKNEMEKLKEEIIDVVHDVNKLPTDCKDVQRKGNVNSGVYRIRPELSSVEFLAWCEMGARGGGWTRIINRFDGSQNFNLNWTDYKNGFGEVSGEHWLGLDHLYQLTSNKSNELLFELVDWDLKKVYALYDNFKIGIEFEHYKIHSIGNYTGDAGDSFVGHVGDKFSTADVDEDTNPGNCARVRGGGWWYHNCYSVHLTGRYVRYPTPGTDYLNTINWSSFHGFKYSLKEVRMMVRPKTG